MARIHDEQGRLDILVNNIWGGNELPIENEPFWALSLDHWENMFTAGVRAQLVTNRFAIPLMREQKSGVILHTTSGMITSTPATFITIWPKTP